MYSILFTELMVAQQVLFHYINKSKILYSNNIILDCVVPSSFICLLGYFEQPQYLYLRKLKYGNNNNIFLMF